MKAGIDIPAGQFDRNRATISANHVLCASPEGIFWTLILVRMVDYRRCHFIPEPLAREQEKFPGSSLVAKWPVRRRRQDSPLAISAEHNAR